MSHKIKLDLNSSDALEDLPNQKISISLGKKSVKNKKLSLEKKLPSQKTEKKRIFKFLNLKNKDFLKKFPKYKKYVKDRNFVDPSTPLMRKIHNL